MTAQLLVGASDTALVTAQNPVASQAGTLPTTHRIGDLLLAFVCTQTALSTGQAFGETTGKWTQISPAYVLNSGKRPTAVFAYAITNQAALDGLVAPNFVSSAAGRWVVRVSRVINADLSAYADGASPTFESGNPTTSIVLATAVTGHDGSLVIAMVHGINNTVQGNPTWGAPPTGFTQQHADNSTVSGVASNDSLYLATEIKTPAGAVGGVTVTVGNAQTMLNGFLVSVKSLPSPVPTPHVTEWSGTSELPAYATVWDGTTEKPTSSMLAYPGDQTITKLFAKTPFYIAHRGGSATYPEETVYSYTQCANMMMKALEISVWRSSDGVFVCSHDQNLLRVTGQSVDIPTTTWAAMSSLMVNPVGTDNQTQPPRPLARIEQVLSRYGMTHVCFVEDKTGVNAAALLDVLDQYGGPSRHVWKAAGSFNKQAIVTARGYKAWGYYFQTDQANFATTYQPWDWVGLDYAMSDADILTDLSFGKPAIAHIIATNAQRDRMLGLGCIGCMTSAVDIVFPH